MEKKPVPKAVEKGLDQHAVAGSEKTEKQLKEGESTSKLHIEVKYLMDYNCTARKFSPLRRKFIEYSINNPALSLLMKHLVIGQSQKAPNLSAFHWSPLGSLVSIGQHFITTRVVHLPKRTETSLITETDQSGPNNQPCSYALPAQPGPIRTRLCGPCIAAIAGLSDMFTLTCRKNNTNNYDQ